VYEHSSHHWFIRKFNNFFRKLFSEFSEFSEHITEMKNGLYWNLCVVCPSARPSVSVRYFLASIAPRERQYIEHKDIGVCGSIARSGIWDPWPLVSHCQLYLQINRKFHVATETESTFFWFSTIYRAAEIVQNDYGQFSVKTPTPVHPLWKVGKTLKIWLIFSLKDVLERKNIKLARKIRWRWSGECTKWHMFFGPKSVIFKHILFTFYLGKHIKKRKILHMCRVMSSIQVRRDINWNVHLDTRRNGLVLIVLESTILSQH
jgi:hypothetical protein